MNFCHLDQLGLPDARCWAATLDQYGRGWRDGFAAAHAERDTVLQDAAAEVVRNVVADWDARQHIINRRAA